MNEKLAVATAGLTAAVVLAGVLFVPVMFRGDLNRQEPAIVPGLPAEETAADAAPRREEMATFTDTDAEAETARAAAEEAASKATLASEQAEAAARFVDGDDLLRFFALFYTVVSVLTFAIQFALGLDAHLGDLGLVGLHGSGGLQARKHFEPVVAGGGGAFGLAQGDLALAAHPASPESFAPYGLLLEADGEGEYIDDGWGAEVEGFDKPFWFVGVYLVVVALAPGGRAAARGSPSRRPAAGPRCGRRPYRWLPRERKRTCGDVLPPLARRRHRVLSKPLLLAAIACRK